MIMAKSITEARANCEHLVHGGAHLLVGGSLLRQLLQCLTGGFGRLKESLKSPVDPRQTQMS